MKLQVERDPLADAVAWTARVIPQRPTAPVMAGMRLHAADGDLTVSAFDYEVSAQTAIPLTADEPGSILVSGKLLAEIVRSLPAKPVQLTTDGTRATVTCGSATFTLILMPAEEYPSLPPMPAPVGTLGADTFATAINQVAAACARDETLPALTGIRMEFSGETLKMIATDRYRLAIRELPWTGSSLDSPVLVPHRVLTDTARHAASAAEVTIALSAGSGAGDGMIGFEAAGCRTTSRLLAAEFPRIEQLLPAEYAAAAELPAAPFAEAVKRVALVAERNTPIRLSFSAGEVLLDAGTGDEAQASEAMDASFDGEDLTVAFNPQFLLDGISATGADLTRILFTSPSRPAVLTPGGETPVDYRYVLMPIRSAG